MTSPLQISITDEKGVIVLKLEGRLDAPSSPILERKLKELIEKEKHRILIDFTNVEYLSSAGMRLLLSMTKRFKALEGNLCFCAINDEVMEIIKMAGFERILQLFSTKAEALGTL